MTSILAFVFVLGVLVFVHELGHFLAARRIGVRDFVARVRHNIRDDHLPLHDIAGIPTCNIIDFDYPRPGEPSHWHTERDIPSNCSALSLAKVGWVLQAWLETMK